MKTILALILLLAAGSALAADLTVAVPAAAVTEASAQCDRQRVLLRIRPADWNNDVCATVMVRLGVRTSLLDEQTNALSAAVTTARNSASVASQAVMNIFDSNFPLPVTPSVCGDSVVDTEFGEECDDGNVVSGDGCDEGCATE